MQGMSRRHPSPVAYALECSLFLERPLRTSCRKSPRYLFSTMFSAWRWVINSARTLEARCSAYRTSAPIGPSGAKATSRARSLPAATTDSVNSSPESMVIAGVLTRSIRKRPVSS